MFLVILVLFQGFFFIGVDRVRATVTSYPCTASDGYVYANAGQVYATQHDLASGIVDGTSDNNYVGQKTGNVKYGSTLYPTLNGDTDEWIRSDLTQTHAQLTNDTNDATYVSTVLASKTELVNFQDLTGTPEIYSVGVFCRVKRTAGTSTIKIMIKSGATLDYGASTSLTTSWVARSNQWTTDPDTGVAWTVSAVNALQVGIYSNSVEVDAYCSEIYVYVYAITYSIYRAAWYVDTSALSGMTITACNVSFYIPTGYDLSTTDFNIVVETDTTYAHPADPLVVGDFLYSLYSGSFGDTFSTSSIGTLNRYYNISIASAQLANFINTTGTTKFMLVSSRDVSSTAPTGDEYIRFSSQESANDPCLVVTYTSANQNWPLALDSGVACGLVLAEVAKYGISFTQGTTVGITESLYAAYALLFSQGSNVGIANSIRTFYSLGLTESLISTISENLISHLAIMFNQVDTVGMGGLLIAGYHLAFSQATNTALATALTTFYHLVLGESVGLSLGVRFEAVIFVLSLGLSMITSLSWNMMNLIPSTGTSGIVYLGCGMLLFALAMVFVFCYKKKD